jgi:hypothetical protein
MSPSKSGFKAKQRPAAVVQHQPKSEGRCDSLEGFTLDCADGRQSDQYNVNMKEIAKYVGREYTYG